MKPGSYSSNNKNNVKEIEFELQKHDKVSNNFELNSNLND